MRRGDNEERAASGTILVQIDGVTSPRQQFARPIPAFVNPLAGNAHSARAALHAAGEDSFEIRDVPPHTLAEHVIDAIKHGATRILIAGGDGSIGTAAGALAGTGVE